MRKLLNFFFAFVLAFAGTVHAKGYSAAVTPTAAGFGVKFASNGQPMATMNTGAASVGVAQSIAVNISPTAIAQVAGSAGIAGAAMGGPWGAAVGAVGAVAMFAIPAFADAYARAKMRVNPTTGAMEQADPATCTVAPCLKYTFAGAGRFWPTAELACTSGYVAFWQAANPSGVISNVRLIGTDCFYHTFVNNSNGDTSVYIGSAPADPSPPAYVPIALQDAQNLISAQAPTADQVQALIDLNFPPDPGPVTLTGPATVDAGNTIKTGLDGSRTEEACKFYLEYFPSTIKAHPECVTTTTTPEKTTTKQETVIGPDGKPVLDSNGQPILKTVTTVTPGTTTTETTVKDKLPDPVTCGLPGTPACVMDETGTPTQTDIDQKMDKDAPKKTQKDIDDIALDPVGKLPKLPTINWAFMLPTGCSVIPTPAFAPMLTGIDVCQFQPVFHDLMSIVWVFGGLFGAISLFMKSSLAD